MYEPFFHEFGNMDFSLFFSINKLQAQQNTAQDIVELPSQIMEHWATEPEVLKKYYAKNYKNR